jgi:hypothetical protein
MHQPVIRFESTPNPNAEKCVLGTPLAPATSPTGAAAPNGPGSARVASRSFRSAAEGQHDPVAARLFAIAGVVGVFIHQSGAWLTITKSPDASWKSIRAGVQAALSEPEQNAGQGGGPEVQPPTRGERG